MPDEPGRFQRGHHSYKSAKEAARQIRHTSHRQSAQRTLEDLYQLQLTSRPEIREPRSTAVEWVNRLRIAHREARLAAELTRLRRYRLIIIDEVGYLPFEGDAANLFFQLISSRYERASVILTSNLPFARRGDVFEDQVVAVASTASPKRVPHSVKLLLEEQMMEPVS